jgi:adenylate cyclase class 2
MRRKTFDFPDRRLNDVGAWVRVRDEGDKVTMSYKRVIERTMEGMQEEMVTVDDFDRACTFLEVMGLVQTSFHENRRETWRLQACEVVIDWWPWILPLVEIEGPLEEDIQLVAETLGFEWSKKLHGGIEPAYEDAYVVSSQQIRVWSSITFAERPIELQAKSVL